MTSPSIGGTVSGGATYTAPVITGPSITGTVGGSATYTTPTLSGATLSATKTLDTNWETAAKYVDLQQAVTQIGPTVTTLIISQAQTITGNLTFPSTLSLQFVSPGKLTCTTAGVTITINGPINAVAEKIFNLSGGCAVVFGKPGVAIPQWWGAAGDATSSCVGTDDTIPIQATVNALPDGSILYLPPSSYKVTTSITTGSTKIINFQGAANKSKLCGNYNGYLLTISPTCCPLGPKLDGLILTNSHATGKGILIANVTRGAIRNSNIEAYYGIITDPQIFSFSVESTRIVSGAEGAPTGSIGLFASGHTTVIGCDITNFDHAIRAKGGGITVEGCRLEVNKTAVMFGQDFAGAASQLTGGRVMSSTFEANDTSVNLYSVAGASLDNLNISGTTNAPSGNGIYGVSMGTSAAEEVRINATTISGSHTKAAFFATGPIAKSTVSNTTATNSVGTAFVWDVRVPQSALSFFRTNYDLKANGVETPDVSTDGVVRYLAAYDPMTGVVKGKNLRGKNVTVGASATTLAVAFTGQKGNGNSAINTIAASAGAGSLAGTYYYVATIVTGNAEAPLSAERSVTVTGPNNQVDLTFFGDSGIYNRRIYRGTATGVYDGYYETAIGANAFTDTGAAFTGKKGPMTTSYESDTSQIEPDANYAVLCTPAWGTTCWTTAKATTGFTLNFGTASPGSTVDWFIVR